jgi:hypothetical protein
MTFAKILVILWISGIIGCAPDYPSDKHHRDFSNEDCINCHVERVRSDIDPRKVLSSHTKGDSVESDHKKCKGCHGRS